MEDFFVSKWIEIAGQAVSVRGHFCAALSGGRTPEGFFQKLSLAGDAPLWRATHIFMADERMVPPDDDASNFKMMNGALFNKAPIPRENIHPVPTDCPVDICAQRYESGIRAFFKLAAGASLFPVFDLVHLGLGDDGHTASLFPGSDVLKENRRLAAPVPDGNRHDRVTLTYPVLNGARNVIFLVAGEDKAWVLRRVAEKDPSLPASAVNPQNGRLLVLADKAAASQLAADSYVSA